MKDLQLKLAAATGHIANYCDHLEHAEEVDRGWVITSAAEFRVVAGLMAGDLDYLHASFCEYVNYEYQLADNDRARQLCLVEFDRSGREESVAIGMSRYDQLRTQAICASILVGKMVEAKIEDRVLALQLLLCGLRLSTIMHEKLDG